MSSRDLSIVLLVILGALVLLPALGMFFMGPGMMGPWMRPGMMGRGTWGGGLWGLGVLLAAVVAIVALLSRRHPADDPLAVLKQRLAKGEITKEQYIDLKSTLQQS
jgi:uncharacterized membrane protein